MYIIKYVGRRTLLCLMMFGSGISCLAFIFLPTTNSPFILVFALLGKFCITSSFGTMMNPLTYPCVTLHSVLDFLPWLIPEILFYFSSESLLLFFWISSTSHRNCVRVLGRSVSDSSASNRCWFMFGCRKSWIHHCTLHQRVCECIFLSLPFFSLRSFLRKLSSFFRSCYFLFSLCFFFLPFLHSIIHTFKPCLKIFLSSSPLFLLLSLPSFFSSLFFLFILFSSIYLTTTQLQKRLV